MAHAAVKSTFTVSPFNGGTKEQQSPNPQMLLDHTSQGDPNISQKEGSSGKFLLGIRPYPRVPAVSRPRVAAVSFLPLCKSWEALMPSGLDSSLGVGRSTVLSPQVVRIDSHGLRVRLGRSLWGELSKRVLTGACRWSTVSNTPARSPLCGHLLL